jgi:hypothetical protein
MDRTVTVNKVFTAVAALVLLTVEAALAQQPSQEQIAAIRASCRSDFMANCSGVQPGGKDALECLKRNLAKLSGSCRSAVGATTASSPPAGAPAPAIATAPAAAAPAAAVPSPTPPAVTAPAPSGTAPTVARPVAHPVAKLTPPPKPVAPAVAAPVPAPPPAAAAVPETPNVMVLPPREALRIIRICAADQQALCAGVPPGGGRIIACLMRNAPALSPPCKDALAMAQAR